MTLTNYNGSPKRPRKGHEVSCAIEAEAVKCNIRMHKRYRRLAKAGKKPNVAKTACASEAARNMWALGLMAFILSANAIISLNHLRR